MDWTTFSFLLKGLVIGFSIAAPVGPIGLLCIRRTLAYGRLAGLVSGLGAATADACYGSIAGFGLTSASALLLREEQALRAVGGLFLLYLGVTTALAKPTAQSAKARDAGLLWNYLSTVALTLTNPITILSFAAVFTGLGIVHTRSYAAAGMLVLGVFLGSAAWWIILSGMVSMTRRHVSSHVLARINLVSGLIICGFGVFAFAELIRNAAR